MKDLPLWQPFAAAGLLAVLTCFAIWKRREQRFVLIGWLWFLGTLVPVIGIVQVGEQQLADRFAYFPSIGLSIAVIWFLGAFFEGSDQRRRLGVGLCSIICIALTITAFRQTAHWSDSETIMRHALAVTDKNEVAHSNLSSALLRKNENEQVIEHAQLAFGMATRQRIEVIALNNWGVALSRTGDATAAIEKFEAAVRRDSKNARAHNNWGNALQKLKRIDEAIEHYETAIEIDAQYADVYNNYANALRTKGNLPAAISNFRIALEFNPANGTTHGNLAATLFQTGDRKTALHHFNKAVECMPNSDTAHLNLALAYLQLGNLGGAEQALITAMAINPLNERAQQLIKQLRARRE